MDLEGDTATLVRDASPSDKHIDAVSREPLLGFEAALDAVGKGAAHRLWVNNYDLRRAGLAVRPGVEPVMEKTRMFNVEQLVDPARGYREAGTRQT